MRGGVVKVAPFPAGGKALKGEKPQESCVLAVV